MAVTIEDPAFRLAQARIYNDLRSAFEDKRAALLVHAEKPINDRWDTIAYLLQAAAMAAVIETLERATDRALARANEQPDGYRP